jgi:hypothetical protein
MAEDSLIDLGKLLRPRQGQDPPPALLGLGPLVGLAVHHRFGEP